MLQECEDGLVVHHEAACLETSSLVDTALPTVRLLQLRRRNAPVVALVCLVDTSSGWTTHLVGMAWFGKTRLVGLCQVGGWWVGCEGPVLPVHAQGEQAVGGLTAAELAGIRGRLEAFADD